jgi:hypothetical protein
MPAPTENITHYLNYSHSDINTWYGQEHELEMAERQARYFSNQV